MEESTLKDRLIEAAVYVKENPGFKIEVWEKGIRLSYIWEAEPGRLYSTESFTPWRAIENAGYNPLIVAFTDLTKQAGVLG